MSRIVSGPFVTFGGSLIRVPSKSSRGWVILVMCKGLMRS